MVAVDRHTIPLTFYRITTMLLVHQWKKCRMLPVIYFKIIWHQNSEMVKIQCNQVWNRLDPLVENLRHQVGCKHLSGARIRGALIHMLMGLLTVKKPMADIEHLKVQKEKTIQSWDHLIEEWSIFPRETDYQTLSCQSKEMHLTVKMNKAVFFQVCQITTWEVLPT